MGTTALTPLPYPESTDQPFVHLDIKALADAVAQALYVESTTAPPHKNGRRWYNPTTKATQVSDGTRWLGGPVVNTNQGVTASTTEQQIGATVNVAPGKYLALLFGGTNFSLAGAMAYEFRIKKDGVTQVNIQSNPGTTNGLVPVSLGALIDTAAPAAITASVIMTGAVGGTSLTQMTNLFVVPLLS